MEIKIFNRWSTADVKVTDTGLRDYIGLRPIIVPKTGARYAQRQFHKSRISIVERLINKLMIPGHKGKKHRITSNTATGKSATVYQIVEDCFRIIESKTKQNPVKVFVEAIENACPREEIVSIEYGGARYPQAVDCAPQRRIDLALRQMVQGSYGKSFNSKRKAAETLADEIINAYNRSPNSNAIAKKLETERQSDSSR